MQTRWTVLAAISATASAIITEPQKVKTSKLNELPVHLILLSVNKIAEQYHVDSGYRLTEKWCLKESIIIPLLCRFSCGSFLSSVLAEFKLRGILKGYMSYKQTK